ncbi:MAG: FkbM family methyltransferase [Deltaproteobacteria bacterium]|nr:MAG: FkbM family methyltransferase [Deltaproteobacteria bacterium]
MKSLTHTLRFIWRHPVTRGHRARATLDYLRWQVGARLVPGPVVAPYVGDTRLVVEPGMTGATGNLYVGLHEFEDMAFVLHLLREGELFADVGANVGSYTVLAAGAARARAISFEPIPGTFAHLRRNIAVNALEERVDARCAGVGARAETLTFTSDRDTTNQVVRPGDDTHGPTVEVPVVRLDDALAGRVPTVLKVDVEGFEGEVLDGASATLSSPDLQGLVIELAPGRGYDVSDLHARIVAHGLTAVRYAPFERALTPVPAPREGHGNALYVRDLDAARARVAAAPRFRVKEILL